MAMQPPQTASNMPVPGGPGGGPPAGADVLHLPGALRLRLAGRPGHGRDERGARGAELLASSARLEGSSNRAPQNELRQTRHGFNVFLYTEPPAPRK